MSAGSRAAAVSATPTSATTAAPMRCPTPPDAVRRCSRDGAAQESAGDEGRDDHRRTDGRELQLGPHGVDGVVADGDHVAEQAAGRGGQRDQSGGGSRHVSARADGYRALLRLDGITDIQSAFIGASAMNPPTAHTLPVSTQRPQRHDALPHVDRLVVGAGFFGLHGALVMARKGLRVAILDADAQPMMRASQVNQARVHNGYHYPRSLTTALSSVHYYGQFVRDFAEAVNTRFDQIYAIAQSQSFMSSDGFELFCRRAGVQCDPVDPSRWFRDGTVESAYRTDEYSFDAERLRRIMTAQVEDTPGVSWYQPARMAHVDRDADGFTVLLEDGRRLRADGILNASYAGTNQVLGLLGEAPLSLKYELCEIILTHVSDELRSVGLTIMDGEYFSLMPYGLVRLPLADLGRVHASPGQPRRDTALQLPGPERRLQRHRTGQLLLLPGGARVLVALRLADDPSLPGRQAHRPLRGVAVCGQDRPEDDRGGRRPADDDHPAQLRAVAHLGPLREDRHDLRPGRGPVKQHKFISVVIRCHNAEQRLPAFLAAVDRHFDERFDAYEIVVVDDASSDRSTQVVKSVAPTLHCALSLVELAHFHGVEAAMVAGLDRAMGDFVFEFDDTFMDYPFEVLDRMYDSAVNGFDVVAASPDNLGWGLRAFYAVCNWFSGIKPPLSYERLRLSSRRALDAMLHQRERIRDRQVLYRYTGYRYLRLDYPADRKAGHHPRTSLRFGLDVFFSFTDAGVRISRAFFLFFAAVSALSIVAQHHRVHQRPGDALGAGHHDHHLGGVRRAVLRPGGGR